MKNTFKGLIYFFFLVLFSCAQKPTTSILKGTSDNFEGGLVKIINISNPNKRGEILDSSSIINHEFELDLGNIDGILPVSISVQNKDKTTSIGGLYLASNSISKCHIEDRKMTFFGNEVQDTFNAVTNEFIEKVNDFQKYFQTNPDSFNIVSNQLYTLTTNLLDRHGQSQYDQFAYSLATNYLAMKFGSAYLSRFQRFCKASGDINQNVWKFNFCRQLNLESDLEAGKSLDPSFELINQKGEIIQLSDFKDKLVLLDFWAYWCAPCIKDIPKLKMLHEKYHSLGLEIISISKDLNEVAWKKAIEKHQGPWTHLIDAQEQTKSIALKLNVGPIPRYVLLDKDHNIVEFDLDSSNLDHAISLLINK